MGRCGGLGGGESLVGREEEGARDRKEGYDEAGRYVFEMKV